MTLNRIDREMIDKSLVGEVEKHTADLRKVNEDLAQKAQQTEIARIDSELAKTTEVVPSVNSIWQPPVIDSTILGSNGVPNTYDPDENLGVFIDPLVDGEYVKKQNLGLDQSGVYSIYEYTFEPKNYEKTMIITSTIHGNEYTAFYSLVKFLDLLVNNWHEYPQLAYIRKNVRLVVVPIVNPWGFANEKRQNVNGVDLNRNFDYNWDDYRYDTPGDTYYKGESPHSEAETRILDDLFRTYHEAVSYVDMHTIISAQAEYILFCPRLVNQDNSNMAKLIKGMRGEGERVVWGSSVLPSMNNYAGHTYGFNSYLPEFYDGIFGEKRSSVEMTKAVRWFGNVIIKASKVSYQATVEGLSQPFIKAYDFDAKRGGSAATMISTNNEYQNFLFTRQKFLVQTNGIVEMSGVLTFNVSEDCTVGFRPSVYQYYAPFFSQTKTEERNNFEVTMDVKAGTYTIPISAIAPVQVSSIVEESVHRTKEVVCNLQAMKSNGRLEILQYKPIIRFTPSSNNSIFQLYQSTERGNDGYNTFDLIYPDNTFDNGEYDDIKDI